ncbi:MAG: hypothetical protein ACREMX_12935, partial [Gemmatimonadales bacterium]
VQGCREISGETVEIEGYRVLGVSADQAWRVRELRQLTARWRGRVDIVIAHPPRRHIHYVTALEPRLFIIRGHSDSGLRRIDGVLAVGTAGPPALIEARRHAAPIITAADPETWDWEDFSLIEKSGTPPTRTGS